MRIRATLPPAILRSCMHSTLLRVRLPTAAVPLPSIGSMHAPALHRNQWGSIRPASEAVIFSSKEASRKRTWHSSATCTVSGTAPQAPQSGRVCPISTASVSSELRVRSSFSWGPHGSCNGTRSMYAKVVVNCSMRCGTIDAAVLPSSTQPSNSQVPLRYCHSRSSGPF